MNNQYSNLRNLILDKYNHYYIIDKLLNNNKYQYNDKNKSIMFNQLQIFCDVNETNNIDIYVELDDNIQKFLNKYLFKNNIKFITRHIPTRSNNILHEINFKTNKSNVIIDIINYIAKNYGEEINT